MCDECDYYNHWRNGSGVSTAAFRKKTGSVKVCWSCPTCKAAKEKGGQSDITLKDQDVKGTLAGMREKLETLFSMHETVGNIERSLQIMWDK